MEPLPSPFPSGCPYPFRYPWLPLDDPPLPLTIRFLSKLILSLPRSCSACSDMAAKILGERDDEYDDSRARDGVWVRVLGRGGSCGDRTSRMPGCSPSSYRLTRTPGCSGLMAYCSSMAGSRAVFIHPCSFIIGDFMACRIGMEKKQG